MQQTKITTNRPRAAGSGKADASVTLSKDEAEVRALIAAWSKALERKDVGGLTANYSPEVLLFDVKPPYRTRGVAEIRRLWQACLPFFPNRFRSVHRDLEVKVSGDLAFAHGLHRVEPIGEEHPAGSSWLRVTVCFQRIGGKWNVVHEHVSFPVDCGTGQMSAITNPDGDG